MKNFLLALMVVLTTCTLAIAQNQTTVVRDSVGKVKVTVTKDNKAKTNNTAVTVIGVDTADTDSTEVDANSSNVSTGHGKASFNAFISTFFPLVFFYCFFIIWCL